jgi:lipopolysaccharide transport system ATP-binding protein
MSDVAIETQGLSKRYEIGLVQKRPDTLRDQISQSLRSLCRRSDGNSRQKHTAYWALRDVSFEVRRGDVVGIVGRNGAGKSTLLKILSRITEPTEGRARIYGRVASLLEVGTGFHRELTGRENIFLNGAILGMKRAEIDRKFDEIVDFSGVEKFIDTPVKRYSSGMFVRLAFAVAAHLEPEILIVDEVLAVGDVAFQKKCLGRMDAVAKQGRTVLFVSHNMGAVRNLCSRAFLLINGRVQLAGSTEEVVQQYFRTIEADQQEGPPLGERKDRSGDGSVRAVGFSALVPEKQNGGTPRTGAPCEFTIEYEVLENRGQKFAAAMLVTDSSGFHIFNCSTPMSNTDFFTESGRGTVVCHLDYLPLKPGRYTVSVKLSWYAGHSRYDKADEVMNAAIFEVIEGGDSGFVDYSAVGPVVVPHQWLRSSDSPIGHENTLVGARRKREPSRAR